MHRYYHVFPWHLLYTMEIVKKTLSLFRKPLLPLILNFNFHLKLPVRTLISSISPWVSFVAGRKITYIVIDSKYVIYFTPKVAQSIWLGHCLQDCCVREHPHFCRLMMLCACATTLTVFRWHYVFIRFYICSVTLTSVLWF